MVYRPGEQKGPEVVPNSYIVMTARGASFEGMVQDVGALVAKEGRADFSIVGKSAGMGAVLMQCDDAFAQKLRELPTVGAVEQNGVVRPAAGKPKGPRTGV